MESKVIKCLDLRRPDNWSRRQTPSQSSPPRSRWGPSGWRRRGGSTGRSAGRGPASAPPRWSGRGPCRGFLSSHLPTKQDLITDSDSNRSYNNNGMMYYDQSVPHYHAINISVGRSGEKESQSATREQNADDSDHFLFQHFSGEMTSGQT